jgi:tripartite-type tricarboxylate transporter receptor subunit TctC
VEENKVTFNAACNAARLVLAFGVFLAGGVPLAQAQDGYPNKPIRLLVGFAAGGPTDIPARFIADKLGDLLGQKVIVENKTGAGGMLATRELLAQPHDGYNLLICSHFESINAAVYRNPQFALDDLAPVSLVSKYFYAMAITNALNTPDWASFLKHARANPGKVSYATIGAGSAQELFARELEKLTGISMTSVPYRGGAPVMQDLLPGRVHLFVSPSSTVLPFIEKDQLKVIAISSPERISAAPAVPTFRENGVDFVRFGWLGVCAAKGTPEPVVKRLNAELRKIVAMPDYQALILKTGSIPESSTQEELRKVIDQTYSDTANAVKEFGLQRD